MFLMFQCRLRPSANRAWIVSRLKPSFVLESLLDDSLALDELYLITDNTLVVESFIVRMTAALLPHITDRYSSSR